MDHREVETSAAFAALSPGAKRALRIIEDELASSGNGTAEISLGGFMQRGLSRVAAQSAIRQLTALGFVELAVGARRVSVFRLADGWRSINDVDAAKRLAREAPSPRAASGKPAVVARPTTLPGAKATVQMPTPTPVRDARTRRPVPSLPKVACLQQQDEP